MNRPREATPLLLAVPAALAGVFFLLPLVGLLAQAPWQELPALLSTSATLEAAWLSVVCSIAAALLSLLLGLPLATWLAQGTGGLRTFVRVLVTLPMVLPPVVGGVGLLLAFGRNGLVGGALERWFAIVLPFSSAGVVLAATYVAMPFFVLTVESGLRSFDRRYTEAAATLGATRWRAFRTVTLPMIGPSLRAGVLVAWARALGEFGATITFAGNLAGETRTLPLAVFVALENEPDAAIALSLLLVGVAAAVLFLLRRHWFPTAR